MVDKSIEELKRRAGITEASGRELQDFMFKIVGGEIGRDEAIQQIVQMAGGDPVKAVDVVLELVRSAAGFPGMTTKLRMGLSKDRY